MHNSCILIMSCNHSLFFMFALVVILDGPGITATDVPLDILEHNATHVPLDTLEHTVISVS